MTEGEDFLQLLAYVRASQHRQSIIEFLAYNLKTPKEIGDALDIRTNHISNLLADLRNHGIVVCVTPNVRKGRLYKLTDEGCEIFENLNL